MYRFALFCQDLPRYVRKINVTWHCNNTLYIFESGITRQIVAYYGFTGGENMKTRVLFICHGRIWNDLKKWRKQAISWQGSICFTPCLHLLILEKWDLGKRESKIWSKYCLSAGESDFSRMKSLENKSFWRYIKRIYTPFTPFKVNYPMKIMIPRLSAIRGWSRVFYK